MKYLQPIMWVLGLLFMYTLGIYTGRVYEIDKQNQEQPKTKEGTMHGVPPQELPKRDTVTYDQHPQKKCWHLHYENR